MRTQSLSRLLRGLSLTALALLTGCQGGILDPKGQVGADEKSLIITATLLMLLVVIPVIAMTMAFAWKFRAGNKAAVYAPKWSHSTKIELVVWIIPIIIVSVLAVITWNSTHKLDPYRPLESSVKPITIEAVSLDWKWLFIYPEQGIATVNQIAFPANTPVNFKITSDSVMNSFFIPQLGGQIYSMAGMQTKLHLIANEAGSYDGMSANYSGGGFSGMKFKAIATKSPAEFDAWVKQVRDGAAGKTLDATAYRQLAKPSENNAVAYYASVVPNLFDAVLDKYMTNRTSLAATDAQLKIAALSKSLCAPSVVKE